MWLNPGNSGYGDQVQGVWVDHVKNKPNVTVSRRGPVEWWGSCGVGGRLWSWRAPVEWEGTCGLGGDSDGFGAGRGCIEDCFSFNAHPPHAAIAQQRTAKGSGAVTLKAGVRANEMCSP